MIAVVIGVVVLVLLVRWRAKRKRLLAGLVANTPTFTVSPPGVRYISLKDHRL